MAKVCRQEEAQLSPSWVSTNQQQDKSLFATGVNAWALQEMEFFEAAMTQAFPVDPKTMKMQLTVVFMRQKGWVDAR